MNIILAILGTVSKRGWMPVLILAAGWYGGAKYGAPDLVIRAVDGTIARAESVISPLLGRTVEQGGEIVADAVEDGGDYVAGTVEDVLEDLAEPPVEDGAEADAAPAEDAASEEAAPEEDGAVEAAAETPDASENDGAAPEAPESDVVEPEAAAPAATTHIVVSEGDITMCNTGISNAPSVGADGIVRKAGATVTKNGVSLLLKPATKSCLSSGYGTRNGKLHKGIDYFSDTGGDVLAAGDGVIRERVTRSDFGNMIVVDHGAGVFTRYAHLASFGSGVSDGATVSKGQLLGPIGNTGASPIVHLHYEILTGELVGAAGSFGLDAVDPFSLPAGN